MSKLLIYLYPKCSTCRNAVKWLRANNHEPEIRDIFVEPPTVSELTELVENSGLDLKRFFNVSGDVYREMGLKDKLSEMSREEQIELLSSNGRLIKRPIVTNGESVTLGFKEDQYANVWSG
ncbi:arsenate reductase family protein [Paenibacillus sp. FA6]|uniref:arsenate reductase family protein n=1 Tax=Paenibacillus sp. FA6 TaxID=3413029 RepID=UPI003F656214